MHEGSVGKFQYTGGAFINLSRDKGNVMCLDAWEAFKCLIF